MHIFAFVWQFGSNASNDQSEITVQDARPQIGSPTCTDQAEPPVLDLIGIAYHQERQWREFQPFRQDGRLKHRHSEYFRAKRLKLAEVTLHLPEVRAARDSGKMPEKDQEECAAGELPQ